MANSIIRLLSSDIASTAALGVNLTDADIADKLEAGPVGLAARGCDEIGGVCRDKSGNLYVSDVTNNLILKVAEGGQISVFAGDELGTDGNNGTLTNVPALDARFKAPRGLACDNSGNIYVADTGNHQIRVIRSGFVSHLAGGPELSGFVDGDGATARFDGPFDVAVDNAGIVYVADTGNDSIRRVTEGQVYTLSGDSNGDLTNVSSAAQTAGSNDIYNGPKALAVDANGDIYVCDSGNNKVKLLKPDGWVYLFSGPEEGTTTADKVKGTTYLDGRYNDLVHCNVDQSGNLYVVDKNTSDGSRIIKLQKTGVQEIVNDFDGSASNDFIEGVAVSPAGKLFAVASA
jgi:sugar lactone lactonase YvrE